MGRELSKKKMMAVDEFFRILGITISVSRFSEYIPSDKEDVYYVVLARGDKKKDLIVNCKHKKKPSWADIFDAMLVEIYIHDEANLDLFIQGTSEPREEAEKQWDLYMEAGAKAKEFLGNDLENYRKLEHLLHHNH